MSNTSSKWRVELEPRQHRVGMAAGAVGEDELAAGQGFSIAAPSAGLGSSGEWSIWCTKSRKSSGFMPCSVISPRIEVP